LATPPDATPIFNRGETHRSKDFFTDLSRKLLIDEISENVNLLICKRILAVQVDRQRKAVRVAHGMDLDVAAFFCPANGR